MISQAMTPRTLPGDGQKFTEATGIQVEVIPYPADAYTHRSQLSCRRVTRPT